MIPPTGVTFEIRMETDLNQVYKILQKALQAYRDEKKGPTLLAVQTSSNFTALTAQMPELLSFPLIQIHIQVSIKYYEYISLIFCSIPLITTIFNDRAELFDSFLSRNFFLTAIDAIKTLLQHYKNMYIFKITKTVIFADLCINCLLSTHCKHPVFLLDLL